VSVRSREEIGWQAEAPAPRKRKPLRFNVGQTLSSATPLIISFFSQLLGLQSLNDVATDANK
jgi:hypothetical protein